MFKLSPKCTFSIQYIVSKSAPGFFICKKNEQQDNYQLSGPIKTDRTCLCWDLLFKNTPHILLVLGFMWLLTTNDNGHGQLCTIPSWFMNNDQKGGWQTFRIVLEFLIHLSIPNP